jgi:hypothetical protein
LLNEHRNNLSEEEKNMKHIAELITVLTLTSLTFSQTQNQDPQNAGQSAQIQQSKQAQNTASSASTAGNQARQVRLQQLPTAVQESVQEHCGSHKINSIERTQRHDGPAYDVEYADENGPAEIIIVLDGTLLQDVAPSEASGGAETGRIAASQQSASAARANRTEALKGHTGTAWSELPPAVQQKSSQYGGEDKIADIDTHSDGAVVYIIEFVRPGPNTQIVFSDDGSEKSNSRIDNNTGQGSFGGAQQGKSSSTRSQDQSQQQDQNQQKQQADQGQAK